MTYSIATLPCSERPRERFLQCGAEGMSTAELLAIVIGSGTRGKSVLHLAHELLARFGTLGALASATVAELSEVRGMGQTRAIQLKAALALAGKLRLPDSSKERLLDPHAIFALLGERMALKQEENFVVVLLNARGQLIRWETIAVGTLTETLVHPREVFHPAIRHKAVGIVVSHNHPSGDPTPSEADYQLTRKLLDAADALALPLYDHLVIGRNQFVSIREQFHLTGTPSCLVGSAWSLGT